MAESVVVTWVIMAVLLIAAAILGRNLKVENVGKKQLVLETIVGGLYNFFYDLLGEEGKQYIPYLMTVGVYIGFANMIGLFGLKSPTKLSLCMRLFGNILGAFVIMELIKIVVPIFVPAVLSLYFDLFDGFIQAYVFVFLTSLFIKESIE